MDETLEKSFKKICESYDHENGGFKTLPKTPSPTILLFLLRYWKLSGNRDALNMVTQTLDNIYKSNLFDHVGLGFFRCTTDEKWKLPVFEKTLSDNSLLAIIYLEVYQATGKVLYADIAEKIFNYIIRNLRSKEGGFFSSEISKSTEHFLWSRPNVLRSLGKRKGYLFCKYYNIAEEGNFDGKNMPNLTTVNDIHNIPVADEFKLSLSRQTLFKERKNNPDSVINEKAVLSWNSLAIIALCMGYRITNDKAYKIYAEKAFEYLENYLLKTDKPPENLDDYSYLTWAIIELYETTYDPSYLKKALLFNDVDQMMPVANSTIILNLYKLSSLTGNNDLAVAGNMLLKQYEHYVVDEPFEYASLLLSCVFAKSKMRGIIINGDINNVDTRTMVQAINDSFLPYTTVHVYSDNDKNCDELKNLVPFIRNEKNTNDMATAYIFEDNTCLPPITDISYFTSALAQ